MRMRWTGALVGAIGVVLLQATAVLAAAPSNDTVGGATAISALPFSESLDTTEATTDADDAALNTNCGAPATDASVWYTLEGTGGDLFVDVSGSDYTAGVLVGVGSPGSLDLVTCGPGGAGFFAESGNSYYILAIDDQFDGAGNGGVLQISVDTPPPAPEILLAIGPTGSVDPKAGTATVRGTATCTGSGVQFSEISGEVTQRAGRVIIRGFFFTEMVCDGAEHSWTANVTPENGRFAGGRADVSAFAFACDAFSCGEASDYRTIQLKGKK